MGLLTGVLYACSGRVRPRLVLQQVVGQLLAPALHPHRRHVPVLAGRALLLRAAPPARRSATFEQQDAARREQLARQGITRVDDNVAATRQALLLQPWWLDWTAGLFPVILVVFLLRSFLFEPFKIPSGSMMPTLLVGDLILVNKFHYGVRLPVINKKIVANHDPERGDVMVFRFPKDPSTDYIKRVVGVPGRRGRVPQPAAVPQRPAGAGPGAAAARLLRRGSTSLRTRVQGEAGRRRARYPH